MFNLFGSKEVSPIMSLRKLSREHFPLIGNNALMLGLLADKNIPIPAGFVVTTQAWENTLKECGVYEKTRMLVSRILTTEEGEIGEIASELYRVVHGLHLSEKILAEITRHLSDLRGDVVVIRPSALAGKLSDGAWKGQFPSFIATPKIEVAQKIISTWESLYTPHTIRYGRTRSEEVGFGMGVIVEEYIAGEISGVAEGDKHQFIVESAYGDSTSLKNPSITPEKIILSQGNHEVISRTPLVQATDLPKENLLSVEELTLLMKYTSSAEGVIGSHPKITWSKRDGVLFILRAYPQPGIV